MDNKFLCYVVPKKNQKFDKKNVSMVIFLPDTFVLVAAKDIIKLVYDDVLRCPVPRNIKILTDAWKNKKVGQVNPKKWSEDFRAWKSQDLSKLKHSLSRVTNYFPLYSIRSPSLTFSYRVQIVQNTKILDYILKLHFRIVQDYVLSTCIEGYKLYNRDSSERKMLARYILLLEHFDIPTLNKTYNNFIKSLKNLTLEQKDKLSQITNFEKSSYLSQSVCPFFSKHELVIMAKNFSIKFDEKKPNMKELYQTIKPMYIDNSVLLKHVEYIFDKRYVGLVDYYTFQGDRIFNTYLRTPGVEDNNMIKKWVNRMWGIIKNSPRYTNDKIILWRFLKTDDHVHITDDKIYSTKSFMSCTRDPLHMNNFGDIVIRIHIPKPFESSFLCIETFSKFRLEHEVLLPPDSRFKVLGINTFKYVNVKNNKVAIKTYDVELLPDKDQGRIMPPKLPVTDTNIPFLNFDNMDLHLRHQLEHKIEYFNSTYTDLNHQFRINIEYIPYIFYWQRYNKTLNLSGDDIVRKYYFKNGGYSWVLMDKIDAKVLLLLEFGSDELHVNYQLTQHAITDIVPISERSLIDFFKRVCKLFSLSRIVIHSNHRSCMQMLKINPERTNEYMFSRYNHDVYEYLSNNTKRYQHIPNVITKTYILDKLRIMDVPRSLHQRSCYLELKNMSKCVSIRDLYIYVVKTLCHHIDYYENELLKFLHKELKSMSPDNIKIDIEYIFEVY